MVQVVLPDLEGLNVLQNLCDAQLVLITVAIAFTFILNSKVIQCLWDGQVVFLVELSGKYHPKSLVMLQVEQDYGCENVNPFDKLGACFQLLYGETLVVASGKLFLDYFQLLL